MEKDFAAHFKDIILDVTGQLDRSVREAIGGAPERQAGLYRGFVAKIMGLLFTELLIPIYVSFPDLEPEDLRKVRTEEVKFIPLSLGVKLLEVHSSVVDRMSNLKKELSQLDDSESTRLMNGLSQVSEELSFLEEYLYRACPGLKAAGN